MSIDKEQIPLLLKRAYETATDSPDPSTQQGSLVVDQLGNIISQGYNTFPKGILITDKLLQDRDQKLLYIEHAERDAIYKCAKVSRTNGHILIAPALSCCDCARGIVLSGISKVIAHVPRLKETPERWQDSVDAGTNILISGGVDIQYWVKPLNLDFTIKVNGQDWRP